MTEFAALKPKTYSYLTDDSDEKKKKQETQKRVSLNEDLHLKILNIVQKQLNMKQINQLEKKLIWIVLQKIIKNL